MRGAKVLTNSERGMEKRREYCTASPSSCMGVHASLSLLFSACCLSSHLMKTNYAPLQLCPRTKNVNVETLHQIIVHSSMAVLNQPYRPTKHPERM